MPHVPRTVRVSTVHPLVQVLAASSTQHPGLIRSSWWHVLIVISKVKSWVFKEPGSTASGRWTCQLHKGRSFHNQSNQFTRTGKDVRSRDNILSLMNSAVGVSYRKVASYRLQSREELPQKRILTIPSTRLIIRDLGLSKVMGSINCSLRRCCQSMSIRGWKMRRL